MCFTSHLARSNVDSENGQAHFKRNAEKQRGMLQRFVALGFRPEGFLPRTAQMVLKWFIRPVGEYGLAVSPGKEVFLKPLQNVQNQNLR